MNTLVVVMSLLFVDDASNVQVLDTWLNPTMVEVLECAKASDNNHYCELTTKQEL